MSNQIDSYYVENSPPHETHENPWHPGEDTTYIERAVRRVRERNGMSTRETREAFRDRMRSLWADAVQKSEYHHNTGGAIADAAEAVYAQALRDLLDHITGMDIFDRYGSTPETTDKMMADFASARGISLKDSDDE